ncbi:MAG: putative manganese-dependent inorganic diphosphatase [Lachnospiraceae bacterium]|nr:putative manganese-dependent inorganic diphosphatase [Lachnospiraceae bacterium]
MEETKRPTFVIGHKNPDTDSICSAISYAYLKNQVEGDGYIAARAGQLNQETQYVLNYFGASAPVYIPDVRTQVRDIQIRKTEGVNGGLSLKETWRRMKQNGVVTIPIVDSDKLEGIITVGDISTSYMDVYDSKALADADTPYKNIVETVEGSMLVGDIDAKFTNGKVLIAAANPDVMEEYIEKGDLVILGNRYESQLCAIEMDAACIVVCDGAKVSKTIIMQAEEHNCVVISTPLDTFTAARFINLSMPISHYMKSDDLVTFHMKDFIEDIQKIMGQKRFRDFPVLDNNDNYVGMISRRNLLNKKRKRLILVDHNEEGQAVDGINHAEVVEIIDHHKLGAIETMSPIFFRNQPLGCTATIITQMFEERQIDIPKQIAGLLCSAIISDTLMFRSPTCTEIDKMMCEKLAKIAGVEIEELAIDMFSAGSDLESKTPEEVLHQDYKTFNVGDVKFAVGQVNSMNAVELEELKAKLEDYIDEARKEEGLDMIFFMLTNIIRESTDLMCVGDGAEELAKDAFNLNPEDGYHLKGLVSRKKQLIPSLVGTLQTRQQ